MDFKKKMLEIKEKIKKMPTIGTLAYLIHIFFFDSWRLLKRHFRYFRDKKFLSPNIELKNIAVGKRVFILACGPSINQQDLKPLRNELCFSVNNFFIHPDFQIIKPEYHMFPSSHSPITDEQYAAWFKDAEAHFPDGQKVLVSVEDKYIVEKGDLFKRQKVYYYYRNGKKGPEDIVRSIDLTRRIPMITTIVHLGIYLGIYLGSKEIYLLGCDHDMLLHIGEYRHFYAEKNNAIKRAGYNDWNHDDLGGHFWTFNMMWETYRKIRNYSERRGIKIYNATLGGILDIFPRIKLEDIL
jgi:hypothetical protein